MGIVLTFVIQLTFAFAAYWACDSTSLDVPQKFKVFCDKPQMPTINDIEVNVSDLDEYSIKKLYRDYKEDILSPAREYFALHKELSCQQGSGDSHFAHFFYAELFFFVASFSIASYWGIFSNIMAIAVAGLVYYKLTKLPLPQQHHDYNKTYNYPDDFVPQYNGYISTANKYGLSDADTVNYIAIKEHFGYLQIMNHFRPLHKRHVGRIVLWTIALSFTVISLICE